MILGFVYLSCIGFETNIIATENNGMLTPQCTLKFQLDTILFPTITA